MSTFTDHFIEDGETIQGDVRNSGYARIRIGDVSIYTRDADQLARIITSAIEAHARLIAREASA